MFHHILRPRLSEPCHGRAHRQLACHAVLLLLLSMFAVDGHGDDELSVSIDAHTAAPPMSKYVYAQFIEHLGRCIYGGIWAEMLEDRKFYYAVGQAASPWSVIGPASAVAMSTEDPMVGRQAPRIGAGATRPAGIAQAGLGLRADCGYEGSIWLKAVTGRPVVEVRLVWGSAAAQKRVMRFASLGPAYAKYPIRFDGTEAAKDARLEVHVSGTGSCQIGTLSLMPDDHVHGMRADTLALLKQLNAPMYRWPGGNFVSGYDWRDGLGPRDLRPPRKNPAWQGVEHNDFGFDEFMAFCREVDAEPLVVVNTGLGDAYSAAQEVEYANGDAATIGGRWRIEHGHPEPFNVRWWGVGNEMYGRWQLGYMQLVHYTVKHNQVVAAMRRVDPDLKLIAVGALNHRDPGTPQEKRGWSEAMLRECGDAMTMLSEHFYCGAKEDLVAHVRQIPEAIRAKATGHRQLRERFPEIRQRGIPIAMDEWNYWHRPYVYGELGCIYHLRDALGIAAGLHEFSRNTDVISMAQYAQTVNVIGCIKTTDTDASFATTGLVLKLYRRHFGQLPLAVTLDRTDTVVDVAAALTKDRRTLTVGVVNPQPQACKLSVQWAGGSLQRKGIGWTIAGDDPMLYNAPGKNAQVTVATWPAATPANLSVPPLSVTLFALPVGR